MIEGPGPVTSIETADGQIRWRAGFRLALPILVLAYATVAATIAPATYADMLLDYGQQLLAVPPLLLVGLGLSAVLLQHASPLSYIRLVVHGRGPRLFATALLVWVGLAAFTTFKIHIPSVMPFYLDPLLADLDHALHGANPGEVAQRLVPAWAGYGLGLLYGPIWFLTWFGLMAAVALHPDAALRRRYFWSMALTVLLLGTVLATVLSSAGPVFYSHFVGGDRFAHLMEQIRLSPVGPYMREATGYLLASYEQDRPSMGTGISAMPSMHLAIATLNALLLARLNRVAGVIGMIYLGLILVGSVYLGWHYAIDGYLSMAVVCLIWWLAGRFARGRQPSARNAIPVPSY